MLGQVMTIMARPRHPHGFTMVELMIGLIILGVLAAVALPAFQDFRLVQRLKAINAQVVTDMQFARAEAVSRNTFMRVSFRNNSAMTCYSLYITTDAVGNTRRCDCRLGAGSACPEGATEVRTVQIPASMSVSVRPAFAVSAFAFDHVTGTIAAVNTDTGSQVLDSFDIVSEIDTSRQLITTIGRTGRPTVCGSNPNLGSPTC
ncbi:GspH/FimT family pseudopilin [Roseateles toxinivorans]|uniref:Type II secretion system protein H n=1 Tax=Roseateles toxinivorans TaxID=270368 RepID=A0A4R6QTF7_9BURK|nr:GspH/FimT family pseudopilin [Roseateles toxinivorans]TDP74950.1 type IV fimbrial biogenesis protein FimT [Roseateles toxinivorans]